MKKILTKIKANRYPILLTILSVFILAGVVRYALRSFQIPIWDEQHYMRMATEFYRMLHNPTWATPFDMLQIVPFRQPGYPLLIMPFYFLFGLSKAYFWAQVVNGLLYVATIWGIYLLTRLYLSKLASFLASFMFAFYGWTLFYLNQTYSENAVSALCVFAIFFLMKSDYFRRRNFSLLFGLFFGLAVLSKWVSFVYVLGPVLYVFYQILVKKLFIDKKIIINAILSFLLALLVFFYPYYTNFHWYFDNWYNHRLGGPVWEVTNASERNPLSIYSLTFYLNSFAKLGILYFILFLTGLYLSFKKKSKLKPILLTFLVGYFFSVYAILKAERHILPIFPYIAIISAYCFDYLKKSWFKTILILLTVIISILSYFGSVWGKGPMKQSLATLPINLPFGEVKKIYLTTISRPPYIYKLSGKEILDAIAKDSNFTNKKPPKILVLFSYRPLDEPLMSANLYHMEEPFDMGGYLGTVITDPNVGAEGLLRGAFKYDYVLLKTGQTTDTYFTKPNYVTLKALNIIFKNYVPMTTYYEKVGEVWINQDSSTVTIWKKKKDVNQEDI
ncbi:MAG TPA: hypothetical protein VF810_01250, partial [Patescibacteria group bacterium]